MECSEADVPLRYGIFFGVWMLLLWAVCPAELNPPCSVALTGVICSEILLLHWSRQARAREQGVLSCRACLPSLHFAHYRYRQTLDTGSHFCCLILFTTNHNQVFYYSLIYTETWEKLAVLTT